MGFEVLTGCANEDSHLLGYHAVFYPILWRSSSIWCGIWSSHWQYWRILG